MNVKKCVNGHYFDADKYQLCPHCGAAIEDELAPVPQKPANNKPKQPFWKKKEDNRDVSSRPMPSKTMGKTFSVFDEAPQEPPRGTKVVRESSRPVSSEPSKKGHRFREDKIITEDSFNPAYTNNQASKEPVDNQTAGNNRYCPSCGKMNSMRAKFCKYCGTVMDAKKETELFEDDPTAAAAQTEPSEESKAEATPRQYQEDVSADTAFDVPLSELTVGKSETQAVSETDATTDLFDQDASKNAPSLQEAVKNAVSGNDGKTVGFFSMGTTGNSDSQVPDAVDPVVGWLVCIKGNHLGESFSIYAGRNAIGRGVSNKIILPKDNKVSREKHAWITYEPKRRKFYIQPGEGSGLAYLNGEMVMESHLINNRDELEIGDGLYLLIPLCGDDFSWEKYIR